MYLDKVKILKVTPKLFAVIINIEKIKVDSNIQKSYTIFDVCC